MRRLIGVLVAAMLVITGCAGSASGPAPSVNPNVAPSEVQLINPQSTFDARTIADWKNLGDAIVIAEITAARADTAKDGDPESTGGVYGRIVTVTVLNTMWARDVTHTPPATFDMNAWGWLLRGNAKQAIVARGEPRLETNHIYLLALARFPTGWGPLGDGSEVPFDGGLVGVGEWAGKDDNDDQPAIDDLLGKNLTEAQATIDSVQPDPKSIQYGNLDPLARAKKLGKA